MEVNLAESSSMIITLERKVEICINETTFVNRYLIYVFNISFNTK